LIFTGLAVAVAFRCGLLNIGAEGQLYVAAFAAAWVGFKFGAADPGNTAITPFMHLPTILLVPLCCIAAIAAGAIWGGIPGVLKAKFGSHEVINTIMLNFIAVAVLSYFTQYRYKIPGDPILQTAPVSPQAHLPTLGRYIPGFPERIPLNLAFILAVVACILVYIFLWKTKWGYELRATGANPSAAEYGGVSIRKQIILAMGISGGLAGNHPVGVFLAAILFAILLRGGIFVDAFTLHVSKDIVDMLQGIVIILVALRPDAIFGGAIKKFGLMKKAKV
jgi:simple sugar transport system permease protein